MPSKKGCATKNYSSGEESARKSQRDGVEKFIFEITTNVETAAVKSPLP